jgi:hypothetical protein
MARLSCKSAADMQISPTFRLFDSIEIMRKDCQLDE